MEALVSSDSFSSSSSTSFRGSDELKKVFVIFRSSLPNPIPETELEVPANLSRYGLSEVVNHIQGNSADQIRPYDFLINKQFLRSTLAQYINLQNIAEDTRLVLEYVEAVPEPESSRGLPHPDWVSSVQGAHVGLLLSGCYDGQARVWADAPADAAAGHEALSAELLLATAIGHTKPIKQVAWQYGVFAPAALTMSLAADTERLFVTASKDKTARVFKYIPGSAVCVPVSVCHGHTDSVEAVAVMPNGTRFVTGSWDKQIMLWDTEIPQTEESEPSSGEPSTKKQKIKVKHETIQKPLAGLSGSGGAVTTLCWPDPLALYSGGYDGAIRHWDVHNGSNVSTWNGTHVVTCVDFSLKANLIATAHNDRVIRIWDPRQKEGNIIKQSLSSHTQWVTGVSWCPTDGNLLLSVSHDQTIKLWDLRSHIPLHTLHVANKKDGCHTDKVLSVSWHLFVPKQKAAAEKTKGKKGNSKTDESTTEMSAEETAVVEGVWQIVSGGADNQLRVASTRKM